MHYSRLLLNGSWDMAYSRDAYQSKQLPNVTFYTVEDAVPGYWEEMGDKFSRQPFYYRLSETGYGFWKYPITHDVPDMSLPGIVGNFFYKKVFTVDNVTDHSELYFEGVQNKASLWLNGTYLGSHSGYSAPFCIKVPQGVLTKGENVLVLSVSNFRLTGVNGAPISGITTRAACEHTGGITGDIELRVYSGDFHSAHICISDDCKSAFVKFDSEIKSEFTWTVSHGDTVIKHGKADGDFVIDTAGLEFWSPENPVLYNLSITSDNIVMEKKFGVRSLKSDSVHLIFNGKPYYLRGVCEHCYYPDTVQPPHDISYYRGVIKKFKELGFNFIRFHTYVPPKEYLMAADELGILIHIESPNNTTHEEWVEIVNFCRQYTSVVIYCCGNELSINKEMVAHLEKCADTVHRNTDSLFSPMSALRCVEYCMNLHDNQDEVKNEPFFNHDPKRFSKLGEFSDVYNSYAQGKLSYFSMDADSEEIDRWSKLYNKPRLSHEICIDGTYTDLSLKDRYKESRIGKTQMFTSIEEHLREKGLLKKAPLFFKNSCQWQRRVRKYCFEAVRKCNNMAGFDFLGPIDTHWHTFGYDVGMMNEFYELKPGETVRNVLMYNSATVILSDICRNTNLYAGDIHSFKISVSHFGECDLKDAELNLCLYEGQRVLLRERVSIDMIANGAVSDIYVWEITLPDVKKPMAAKLCVTLDCNETHAENEWEIYLFPKTDTLHTDSLVISDGMSITELVNLLKDGRDIVLFGAEPFVSMQTSFRISLAGRTSGNLATVIYDHSVMSDIPHDGFCGWQFNHLLENGRAICFDDNIPFEPIIEIAPTHKNAVKQASMFEYKALNGRLFVCGFNFDENDASSVYLKNKILDYVSSNQFNPTVYLAEKDLYILADTPVAETEGNTNFAFNKNDIVN